MSAIFETTEEIYGVLPKTWHLTTLGDLIENKQADLQTGPFGTMLHASSYKSVGTPVLAVQHIGENRIIHKDDIPRVDEETYQRLSRYEIKKSDIIFCRKGAVERTALVTEKEHGWLQGSDCIRLRLLNSNINPIYISYVFCSSQYRKWIVQHAHGATMPSLNQQIINLSPVPLPPLEEQNRIADVLFCIDRKIENLRKQNETLEEIARSIFKHWFIDFEFPNADGKPYKSSGGVMVRSELGDIPEGWYVGKLGDEFEIIMGQSPAGSSFNEEKQGMVFFQGRTDFGFRFPTVRLYTTEPKRIAEKFDVLVSVRAPVGDINVACERCCIGRGLAAIRSEYKSYCLHKLKSFKKFFDLFESEGTVFGSINKQSFNDLTSIIPTNEAIKKFEILIISIDKKFYLNNLQIQTLTKTRDTLLPKLMSGQLRVEE
jgi:type I restriction enzyme, S subunit